MDRYGGRSDTAQNVFPSQFPRLNHQFTPYFRYFNLQRRKEHNLFRCRRLHQTLQVKQTPKNPKNPFIPSFHQPSSRSIPPNQAGKIGKKEIYKKYPILHKAVERHEPKEAGKEEEKRSKSKNPGDSKPKGIERQKKKKKQFQFVFKANEEIGLNELQDILAESPYKFNFPVLKEVFDAFLSDDGDYVNVNRLCDLLQSTGLATFSNDSDKKILIEALDKDKDGKISYQDLLYNIPLHNYSTQTMSELKKHLIMESSSPLKDKKKVGKKQPTCCIINKDKILKNNNTSAFHFYRSNTLQKEREEFDQE